MIGTETALGPATVTETEGRPDYVRVEREEGESVWARLALAVPYQPVVGDEVLVAGAEPERTYVIGLLRGTGKTTLRVSGDLALEAPNGSIDLSAARGVRVGAPEISLRAGKLEFIAQRILEKARDAYVWISELFQLKSRRMRAVAETTLDLRADTAYVKAKGEVNIDGRSIHLG